MREAQGDYEASGLTVRAAYSAGNLSMTAILWDFVDDPEVSRAIQDSTRLARSAGAQNVVVITRLVGAVIRVLEGTADAGRTVSAAGFALSNRGFAAVSRPGVKARFIAAQSRRKPSLGHPDRSLTPEKSHVSAHSDRWG
jgi:hypothetical protein